MKSMTKTIAISSAIAAGLMMATAGDAFAAKKAEKCYGVAKAGKNDCAVKSLGTSCAGTATGWAASYPAAAVHPIAFLRSALLAERAAPSGSRPSQGARQRARAAHPGCQ